MTGKIKHRFQSAKSDGGDPTLVNPSNWNDSLVMSEGTDGQIPVRDSSQADGWQLKDAKVAAPFWHGQCRLSWQDATHVVLKPYNGNLILVQAGNPLVWQAKLIPSSGVVKDTTGLAASTTYYVYLYDNAGTLALEFSATGHVTDTGTSVEVKSGDNTRVLVGQVRTNGSIQFVDSATQRFVASWFNRHNVSERGIFTVDRSTTSTTLVEINTEIRVEFVAWADEALMISLGGQWLHSAGAECTMGPALDGSSVEGIQLNPLGTTMTTYMISSAYAVTEGYHYATLFGRTASGTVTWKVVASNCWLGALLRI